LFSQIPQYSTLSKEFDGYNSNLLTPELLKNISNIPDKISIHKFLKGFLKLEDYTSELQDKPEGVTDSSSNSRQVYNNKNPCAYLPA